MSGSGENDVWPLPKFAFQVTGMPGNPVFQEVSGLQTEVQAIEYKAGNSKTFSTVKMPGLAQPGNVTFKTGLFTADKNLWTWLDAMKMNAIERTTITVQLLDQAGAVQCTWVLYNAYPVKVTGTDSKSDSNEVVVESIEVAYETMMRDNKLG